MNTTLAFALAGLVAGCRPTASPQTPARAPEPTASAPPLRLVVVVVIDQLPAWSFGPHESLFDGGLGRMLAGGLYFPAAEYPYAVTFTSPGHATLGTGAMPRTHGIIGNHWFDRSADRTQGAAFDPQARVHRVLSRDGAEPWMPEPGSSGSALAVPGIADALERRTDGRAHTIAIGLKDRAAAFVLGRQPDLVVWYDPAQVAMTTSTAYSDAMPGWLVALAKERPIGPRLRSTWNPLRPDVLPAASGHPDDRPGEDSDLGFDRTFPHELAASNAPQVAVVLTPLGNDVVFETAIAAIEGAELGLDDVPDLLALTFSAHDYAGHLWGQDSWERIDHLLRIDRALADFLDLLDARLGRERYAVVLTSDHGATPLVEHSRARGIDARRIHHRELLDAANRGIAAVLGAGTWVKTVDAGTVYVDAKVLALAPTTRTRALQSAAEQLAEIDGIAHARPAERLTECGALTDDERLACHSLFAGRSGELHFGAAKNFLVTEDRYTAGTGHGSPAEHDRLVPLVIMGPGVAPRRSAERVSILRVAPTIAALLGVPMQTGWEHPIALESPRKPK
jgi:predicted AlkP superfamily pyrophosphatase or phosphodiesterase